MRPEEAPASWRFDAAAVVLGAVLLALAARLAVPFPGSPVPFTGQSFAALALGALWGRWRGSAAVALYLLVGAAGAPVFADGAAGVVHLLGRTGGYLVGLAVGAWTAGWLSERSAVPSPVPPSGGKLHLAGRLLRELAVWSGLLAVASVPVLLLGYLRLGRAIGWWTAWEAGVRPFLAMALLKAVLAALVLTAARRRLALGVMLFLFIPLVLWLLVGQPEPLGWSLAAALVLMLGHRFLARPYMDAVRRRRCVWCCRRLGPKEAAGEGDEIELAAGGGTVPTVACQEHRASAGQFFSALEAARLPLALGIFVPLLALLTALAIASAGRPVALGTVTAAFRLCIGLTVVAASAFYPLARDRQAVEGRPPRIPFPVHNFFLLGVRALLWVFRVVGAWWIVLGARALLG